MQKLIDMEPNHLHLSQLEQQQKDWDEEHPKHGELVLDQLLENQVKEKVKKAKDIADAVAHYSGGHMYLGRDALSRDYYSDWATLNKVELTDRIFLQARLTSCYDVVRDSNQIETGVKFSNVMLDVRLYDLYRDLSSPIDIGVYKFSNQGITKKEQDEWAKVLPGRGDPAWEEIDQILNKIHSELVDKPRQGQLTVNS